MVLAAGILLAQRADRNIPRTGAPGLGQGAEPQHRFFDELELSEAQMKKFTEGRATYERQSNTISAEIKNLRMDLMEALKAENIKLAKDINRRINAKELELSNARIDLMASHLKELSKEQKAIMLENLPMMMDGQRRWGNMDNMRSRRNMQNMRNRGHRSGMKDRNW